MLFAQRSYFDPRAVRDDEHMREQQLKEENVLRLILCASKQTDRSIDPHTSLAVCLRTRRVNMSSSMGTRVQRSRAIASGPLHEPKSEVKEQVGRFMRRAMCHTR